jgi:S1-C subfamily serine protease
MQKFVQFCIIVFCLVMKKFLMLMILIIAIIFLGSSCGDSKTPRDNFTPITPTPTSTPTSTSTPTPTPTPTISILTPEKIRELAEETTVFITGGVDPGSGVIIEKEDDTYYVLTAEHVVTFEPEENEPSYELQTKDKKEHIIAGKKDYQKNVKKFGKSTDLAVIQFTAEQGQEYKVAPLAQYISLGMPVYAFGWTSCSKGDPPQLQKQFQITEGKICEIKPDSENGWNLSYTNQILVGMSGGPVFNSNGQVVAIQAALCKQRGDCGKVGSTSNYNSCASITSEPYPRSNYSLGVSIRGNFETLKSNLPPQLQIEVQSDNSSQNESEVNIQCGEKPPVKECPGIFGVGETCDSNDM